MRERKLVRVSDLEFGPNVRKTKRSEAELRALGKGLREKQLAPIWINLKNVVLIGEGRVRAALMEGLETLDAIVTDELEDEGTLTLAQSQENWLRHDLKDTDRVMIVLRLKDLYPKALAKDIAEKLHVDPSTITRLMSVSTVIPLVREAFEAGAITLSHVYELSKLDPSKQHELLPVALSGATRDFIGKEGRKTRKARPKAADPVSSSTVTIPLPSGIRVVVRGKRLTLAEVLECLSECVDAARKGIKEKLTVKSWVSVLRDRIARCPVFKALRAHLIASLLEMAYALWLAMLAGWPYSMFATIGVVIVGRIKKATQTVSPRESTPEKCDALAS